MKKNITAMILAAILLVAMLPIQAFAAEDREDRLVLEAGENMLVVKLTLPDAAGEKITSLQLTLELDAGSFTEFAFDQEVTKKAKVYEVYYDQSRRKANLYIAGTEPLYTQDSHTLAIGSAGIQSGGGTFVNVQGRDVKVVRGTQLEDKELSEAVRIYAGSSAGGSSSGSGTYYPGTYYPGGYDPGSNQVNPNPGSDGQDQPDPEQPSTGQEPETPPSTQEPDTSPDASSEAVLQPRLSKVQNTAAGVTIKWARSSNASGYYVYRKAVGGSWKRIAVLKGRDQVSYTDKAVKSKNGRTYIYTVKAYQGQSVSKYDKKGLKIYRLTAPVLSGTVSRSSREMLVNWKQNPKASGYQVQYARSADFKKQKAGKTVGQKASVKITKLKQKKTYYVRVRSYKKTGSGVTYSAWSKNKKVKIR